MQKSKLIIAAIIALVTLSLFGTTLKTNESRESTTLKSIKDSFESFFKKSRNERIYIQTDKGFYKPGEIVWFAAHVRNDDNLKASDISDIIYVELISPRGSIDKNFKLLVKDGIAKGDLDLTGYLGGIYKLKAYTQFQKNDSTILMAEKEITIQSAVLPRLKLKLDFDKKAYGKGDEVAAKLHIATNEDKDLANSKISYTVLLAGNKIKTLESITDKSGKSTLKFSLPKDLKTSDGILNIKIDYEGDVEAISRTIPIVLNKVDLEFMPEGGDLIESVASKVGFRATNEFGKPADIEGLVMDNNKNIVCKFSSLHDGMGKFAFTPQSNKNYVAKITKPEGIEETYTLPDALKNGYSINAVSNEAGKLQLSAYSFKFDTISLIAQTRGKIFFSKSIAVQKGWTPISINTEIFPIGIAQITLFDGKGVARSERLVFVNRGKQLNVKISTTKETYKPREKVVMNIRTTDEQGLPISSDLALSVVDDNLLSFADDKQGNILSKMLLEPELKQTIHEPNFYFDTKEPKSEEALDNLLMTAGWRRYAWKQIEKNKNLELSYAPEKAIVAGKILDGYESKPVSGAKVSLKKSGKSVITDKDGVFIMPMFDITQENELSITAKGFNEQNIELLNYDQNATYYLYKGEIHRPVFFRGGRAPMEVDAVMNMAPMVAAGIAEQAMEVKYKNPMIAAADLADKKDEAKKDALQNLDDKLFENGEVGDLRFAEIKKKEEIKEEEETPVLFYRAKEFPKKVYAKEDNTRSDLQSTVYWNGHVSTDQNGKATIEFLANDLISSFKATAEGFGANGEIGRAEHNYVVNNLLVVDAKIPTELVSGDVINLPVFIKNNTDEKVEGVMKITLPKMLSTKNSLEQKIFLDAREARKITLPLEVTSVIGKGEIVIEFNGSLNDKLSREVNVVAKGFPANISLSAQELNKTFLINPTNVVPGSMRLSFSAYPNVMTELMKGIEAILQEPYGCFEQTSSSNYPNIMVLDYMRKMKIDNPELEAKAMRLLDEGYKKLIAFETKENGYEWFGAAPAHEALTAYGLIEFEDMKAVYPKVDQAMINRTLKMLLEKRDGKGGFVKNPKALDSFGGADEDITNAYIVYAMTESGYKELAKELDALYESAKKSRDPYIMALAANAFYNVADNKRGDEMLNLLYKEQSDFGFWNGKKHSITRSTGNALKIETTSLVSLAIIKSPNPNQQAIQSAMKFIVGSRSGLGGFGSTQSTILALKALTKYAEFSKKTDEAGTIEVYHNDKLVGTKDYAKGEKGNVVIENLEKYFTEGKQKIEVRFKGCKTALPYSMNVAYNTILPQSSKECVLDLSTKLSEAKTKVGETVRLSTTLKNKTNLGQPMSIAIIGLPAGLSAQPWQLKEMRDKNIFDFYEMIGNNIVVYYRSLAPNATREINFDLKAEVSGAYDAPASSAYLYYTNEHKVWKSLERVLID
jgi:hypothetical protein